MTIGSSAIPDQYKVRNARSNQLALLLTGLDVAPNGDIYVTDGYASDYIHRFDKTGKYIASFGGKQAPYSFNTLHKLAIDTRFQPARIIACDRANNRVVHLSLDGDFLGVVAKDLLLPAAIVIDGDNAIVGELNGRVTVLDKSGRRRRRASAPIPNRESAPTRFRRHSGVRGSCCRRTESRSTRTAICSSRSSAHSAACIDSTGSDLDHRTGQRQPDWTSRRGSEAGPLRGPASRAGSREQDPAYAEKRFPHEQVVWVIGALSVTLFATVGAQSPEPKPAFQGQTDAPRPAKPSAPFNVQTIATGLTGAWAIAFLPDGNFLVTQNAGTMRIVRPDGVVLGAARRRARRQVRRRAGAARRRPRSRLRANRTLYFTYFAPPKGEAPALVADRVLLRARLDEAVRRAADDAARDGAGGAGAAQRGQHDGSRTSRSSPKASSAAS